MYNDARYAKSRLVGTVVMLKRTPVQVVDIDYMLNASIVDMQGKRPRNVPCNSLNVLDFSLGFLNKNGEAVYISRRPMRHDWRQGLRPVNVHCTSGRVSVEDIGKVLLQRYPTYKQVLGMLADKLHTSIAWCQEFAVTSTSQIIWQYDAVGERNKGGDVVLYEKFKFLQPILQGELRGYCTVF